MPLPPAPATISGDGVSPAATAIVRGSPPGSAAASAAADGGRFAGTGSKQRRIARSTAGSIPLICVDGLLGVDCCSWASSSRLLASSARLPVKSS